MLAIAVIALAATGATVASYIWQGYQHVFTSVYFGVIVGLLATWLASLILRLAKVPRRNSKSSGGIRNPIDAVGVWYRDLASWKQIGLALIVPQVVVTWWLIYQFRRGWFGPPAERLVS